MPSQPELVLRQRFAGKPRAGQTILRSVESSGVRSSSGFSASKPVRRGSSSGRSSPGSRAPERRQRAFCFVESPENARQSSGFSASKPGRRGSSRGRVSPGKNVPSQPELVLRQRFAGKPRAGQTILRSVESAGVRPSSGFSASKSVRRGSSSRRASPGKNVPSQPELVLRQRFAGKPRAGQTILRSVESSGVRPSSGFSVSKPVRHGSSSGRVLPGRSAPSQPELVLRQRFAGETRVGCGKVSRRGGGRFYVP